MNTEIIKKLVGRMIELGATRAIKFITPIHIVRATRRCYGGRIRNQGPIEILITIGKPNYKERKLIKDFIRAGEPFPIKREKLYFPKKIKRA